MTTRLHRKRASHPSLLWVLTSTTLLVSCRAITFEVIAIAPDAEEGQSNSSFAEALPVPSVAETNGDDLVFKGEEEIIGNISANETDDHDVLETDDDVLMDNIEGDDDAMGNQTMGDDDDGGDDDGNDDWASYYDDDTLGTPTDISSYVVPKFMCVLSLLGSSAIIAEVLAEHQHSKRSSHANGYRSSPSIGFMLVSMSLSDIIFSTAYFVGNWASPTDTPYMWDPRGNTASCTAQGFFIQVGWAATPCFSLFLSVYYLLIVRYNWSQAQLRRLDPWIHGVTWSLAIIMAIIPIPLEMYNDSFGICWVEAMPFYCGDDDFPCTRGHQAGDWALFYTIFPPWICLFASTFVMGMLYSTVRGMEKKHMKSVIRSESGKESIKLNSVNNQRSKRVGNQAIMYLSAYYLVYVPEFIAYLLAYINGDWWNLWYDFVVYSILLPLLGFFNFVVFARRRDQMHTAYGKFLSQAICCFDVMGATLRKSSVFGSKLRTSLQIHLAREVGGSGSHRMQASSGGHTVHGVESAPTHHSKENFYGNHHNNSNEEEKVEEP